MAEYIEKQQLMKNFAGYDLTQCQKYGNTSLEQRSRSYDTMMMYEIAIEIDNIPIEDVVKVVRCCDCIHNDFYFDEYGNKIHLCRRNKNTLIDPMGYCSFGEERDKDE